MSGWAFMWTIAAAIYGGCKWLTFREARASRASFRLGYRALNLVFAYLPAVYALAAAHRQWLD
jgi:hypothetical protein